MLRHCGIKGEVQEQLQEWDNSRANGKEEAPVDRGGSLLLDSRYLIQSKERRSFHSRRGHHKYSIFFVQKGGKTVVLRIYAWAKTHQAFLSHTRTSLCETFRANGYACAWNMLNPLVSRLRGCDSDIGPGYRQEEKRRTKLLSEEVRGPQGLSRRSTVLARGHAILLGGWELDGNRADQAFSYLFKRENRRAHTLAAETFAGLVDQCVTIEDDPAGRIDVRTDLAQVVNLFRATREPRECYGCRGNASAAEHGREPGAWTENCLEFQNSDSARE
ncbi:hypothetical protein B0H17DRAFT_1143838 [Mycena rosella]|uniref:Uncharacterized protein n=1 Tax=Mycena rosella TaxID=1033263 RepID=A0AAD7G3K3_MYCRO|nr:hypothetical protein B0H17DRAFT_1143838 [Mycena rosella]